MTVTDDEVEVPDAAPLPAEAPPPPAEGGGESTHDHQDQDEKTEAGPPPLPPLLEAGASSMVTAGSGIYAAAGPAGLVAAMGVATVAGVAYGVRRSKKNNAAAGRSNSGVAGRFFGTPGTGAGRRGGGRFGSLSGGRGGGRGAGGAAGLGRGRHRSANGSGGLTGAAARAARRNGARSGGLGSAGARSGSGRLFGPGGSGRTGGSSLLGGRGAASRGAGLFGGGTRSGPGAGRSGAGGLFGGSTAGSRSGRTGGLGSSRRSGTGLFGGAAGRSARRRGRVTAITDPAARTGSGRGRGHHRLRRVVKRGWEHPRVQRTRVRARKGWHRSRVRIRSHSKRLGDYLRKRKWTLRVKGWGHSFADWWSGIWSALTGRASDPRYGPLKGWQLGAAAVAIGAIGAGKKTAAPRPPLVGRVIGTAAPTPDEDGGPLTLGGAGRVLLALTLGEGEEVLAPEVQRMKTAAEELKSAMAALGGADIGMLEYLQGLKELESSLTEIADGIKEMGGQSEEEQPVGGSTLAFFGTIEDAVRGSATIAEEMPGLFEAEHEVELERLRNPRRGEAKWDITHQHNN